MHRNDMHSFRATGSSVKGLGSGVFFPTETLSLAVPLQAGQEILVTANNQSSLIPFTLQPLETLFLKVEKYYGSQVW